MLHIKGLFAACFQLAGATYMEVHKAGGGIHFTVDHVRNATVEELYADFKQYTQR